MTFDELARDASERLHVAYWAACDAAGSAVDPADLTSETWAAELLAEAYDIALQCESDPIGWDEGRAKF